MESDTGASTPPNIFGDTFIRYARDLGSAVATIKTMLAQQELKDVPREQISEIAATVQGSARSSIKQSLYGDKLRSRARGG
jgi:DNA-binding transcriptional MerR regulator